MSEFTRLLESEIPPLRRYARALTRNTEKADDLVQSCLMRALAKEHLWQPGTNLRLWIFTILHNLHVDSIRRSAREQDRTDAIAFPVRAESDPDSRLDLLDVDRAIARLPEAQRRVILLIGLEGMGYDEAAAVLRLPIGTIRSRIARARESLRKLLRQEAATRTVHETACYRRTNYGSQTLIA